MATEGCKFGLSLFFERLNFSLKPICCLFLAQNRLIYIPALNKCLSARQEHPFLATCNPVDRHQLWVFSWNVLSLVSSSGQLTGSFSRLSFNLFFYTKKNWTALVPSHIPWRVVERDRRVLEAWLSLMMVTSSHIFLCVCVSRGECSGDGAAVLLSIRLQLSSFHSGDSDQQFTHF